MVFSLYFVSICLKFSINEQKYKKDAKVTNQLSRAS